MRFSIYFLVANFLFFPSASSAAVLCSQSGYTIATINGVFTDESGARDNMVELQKTFGFSWQNQEVIYQYLLNPSHVGGLGDWGKAALQKIVEIVSDSTVNDYDLAKMIQDASEKVTTQKLLLVAHSQGNFYANGFYDAVAGQTGGVPVESIGVYSVATPASRVAGGGAYLTSSTDLVITPIPFILSPNTRIEEVVGELNPSATHSFSDVYLKYRGERIVSDVQAALDKLQPNDVQNVQERCIDPPKLTLLNRVEGAVLVVADTAISAGASAVKIAVAAPEYAGTKLGESAVVLTSASIDAMEYAGTQLGNAAYAAGTFAINTLKDVGKYGLALLYNPFASGTAAVATEEPADTALPQNEPALVPVTYYTVSPEPIAQPQEPEHIAVETPQPHLEAQLPSEEVATTTELIITEEATSTDPVVVEEAATSTEEAVIVPPPPAYTGSAWVSGVSPDAAVSPVNLEAELPSEEGSATSTEDEVPIVEEEPEPEPEVVCEENSLVINEIAWMGTLAEENNEWIELYNKGNCGIDLTGWTLESKNQRLLIELEGTIAADGYFLLERTATTTTDQEEDMVYTGALDNFGFDANVYLKNGTTTVDTADFGYWPFGSNDAKRTMERISPFVPGTSSINWNTYSETVHTPFAKDADGNDISGTPGAKNSKTGFYTPAGSITENTTWYKKYSPYYVSFLMTVYEGATLTIEPGVVVKFKDGYTAGAGMSVRGVLVAEGMEDDPIVFTSFLDDDADNVDSNQDEDATSPDSADWANIIFLNATDRSVVRHARVTYGGQGVNNNPNGFYPTFSGAFSIRNASPEISDVEFDTNHTVSVYVKGDAHPILSSNTIRNTVVPTHVGAGQGGFGIQLYDASSTADIIGNTFESNRVGISSVSATSTPLVVKDNTFADNEKAGEFIGYPYFNLDNSGNTGDGAFYISTLLVTDGAQRTLHGDGIPYVFQSGFTVEEGGTLIIEPGAELRNTGAAPFTVRGTLTARGTESEPIVFVGATESAGAWENIQFIGASSSDSVLEHVAIRFGGRGTNTCPYAYLGGPCMVYKGAVRVATSSPEILHMTFENNLAIAIYIEGDASPDISHTHITDTEEAIVSPIKNIGGIGISIGAESSPTLDLDTITFSENNEDIVERE